MPRDAASCSPPNGSALSCEPQRLRGSIEGPEFDAKRYHGPLEGRCGSAAAAPCCDLDAAIAEVEAAGGKLIRRGEHSPGASFAYVQDPDGYVIEL